MVKTAVRLWTSQPTKRSIAHRPPCRISGGKDVVRGSGTGSWSLRPRRSRSVLRGESTTTYASSKLNRVGRRAARYDSGLSAHKHNRPAHKRPTPHRIAVGCCAVPQDHVEQIACSRSRCGNFTPFTALFPPLPPVNPCPHRSSVPLAAPPQSPQHNHARYDQAGRITQIQKVIGTTTYPITYQYNPGGHLTQITYPSNRVVQQNVDNIGLLNTIVSGTTTYASIPESPTGYNAAGQILTFTYGNGVSANFGYS